MTASAWLFFTSLFLFKMYCQAHSNHDSNCKGNTIIQYFGSDVLPTQHFNHVQQTAGPRETTTRPGKMGPVGPKGEKGEIGLRGHKGDDYNPAELRQLKEELAHLRRSCVKKSELPLSCATVQGRSGFYLIQPDIRFPAFSVYCNFSDPHQIKTVIGHNVETERAVEECEPNFCFKVNVNYTASLQQIAGLISVSIQCRQYIKLKCQGSLLHHQSGGVATAWISRTGARKLNWGGSQTDGYCACGETNTCIDRKFKCNCDQNSESLTTADDGYLKDKNDLPVTALHIGDTGGNNEHAWYTVGKLEFISRNNSTIAPLRKQTRQNCTKTPLFRKKTVCKSNLQEEENLG